MSTRLVAHRPHATFRWNHLARVGQVGGGTCLARYAENVRNPKRVVCQLEQIMGTAGSSNAEIKTSPLVKRHVQAFKQVLGWGIYFSIGSLTSTTTA